VNDETGGRCPKCSVDDAEAPIPVPGDKPPQEAGSKDQSTTRTLQSRCDFACSLSRKVKQLNVWCTRQLLCDKVQNVNNDYVVPYTKACLAGVTTGGGVAALTGGGVLGGAVLGCSFEGFLFHVRKSGERPIVNKAATAYTIVDLTISVARLKTMLAKAIYEYLSPITRRAR